MARLSPAVVFGNLPPNAPEVPPPDQDEWEAVIYRLVETVRPVAGG